MDLASLTLAISLGHSAYTDTAEPEYHLKVTGGPQDSPLYLWGQYEELSTRMLGQGIGDSSIASFGIGARKFHGPFFGYFEIGYGVVDEGANKTIQQEVVYTELLLNHRVDGRPAPVLLANDYDQDSYDTVWELEDGLLGEVGVGYQWGSASLSVSYRPFYVKEHIELRDPDWMEATGIDGWWQETRNRNLSAVQVRVGWEF